MLYQAIPLIDQLNIIAAENGFGVVDNLGFYISQIVALFLIIASIAALAFLVWGGLQWIMAGSDKTKLEEAKSRLTNAIVGLAIVAASWAVFLILNYFFGLNIIGGSTSGGGGGGGSGGGGSPPAGYCLCGNGECAANGTVGPLTYGGACYVCQNGSWQPTGGTCPAYINCSPCP